MGTSGNRKGYKMFSFNTTVRNPRRNRQFLQVLVDLNLDGEYLTEEKKRLVYCELIRRGVYHVTNMPRSVKEKYQRGELLTSKEIEECRKLNPQMTKDEGRARTHIVALRYTGLLNFIGNPYKPKIQITPLGRNLINNDVNIEDIYSKSMIGLHYSNPQRTSVDNQSRPFLNTLFVIKEVNDFYNYDKGIKKDEFAVFVLTMKDCNYKAIAKEIIEFRKYMDKLKEQGLKKLARERKKYIYFKEYMEKIGILPVKKDTIGAYYDDVYRKFEMTGLIVKTRTRVTFSEYNIEKVNSLLDYYKDYTYEIFLSTEAYTKYLSNIHLPRVVSDDIKKKIIEDKIKSIEKLVLETDEDKQEFEKVKTDELSLDDKLSKLDQLHYRDLFSKTVNEFSIEKMLRELLIISRNNHEEKSEYDEVEEWIRLERFTALITAKIYGSKYVKPNLTLDERGVPISGAQGNNPDVCFITESLYCLLEVTTIRNSKQQENSETTSISTHLRAVETNKEKVSYMIAPYVHKQVVDFFQARTVLDKTTLLAITIEAYIKMILEKQNVPGFIEYAKWLKEEMMSTTPENYCAYINEIRLPEEQ